MLTEETKVISLSAARSILDAMGYVSVTLSHVSKIPEPALVALYNAWESLEKNNLQRWQLDLVSTLLLEAMMEQSAGQKKSNLLQELRTAHKYQHELRK